MIIYEMTAALSGDNRLLLYLLWAVCRGFDLKCCVLVCSLSWV